MLEPHTTPQHGKPSVTQTTWHTKPSSVNLYAYYHNVGNLTKPSQAKAHHKTHTKPRGPYLHEWPSYATPGPATTVHALV